MKDTVSLSLSLSLTHTSSVSARVKRTEGQCLECGVREGRIHNGVISVLLGNTEVSLCYANELLLDLKRGINGCLSERGRGAVASLERDEPLDEREETLRTECLALLKGHLKRVLLFCPLW